MNGINKSFPVILPPTYQLQLKINQVIILPQEVLMGLDLIWCDGKAMCLGKGCYAISQS
ncbi:hypothetical protein OAV24_04120 [Gammaproteobacteria bacterium]|jgi:hypothetical protein|nr:hypothetical protein [Gammaproteobacteria bacterium]